MENSFEFYSQEIGSKSKLSTQVEILESDTDLYWSIALEMHASIREANLLQKQRVFICPVGPVYQYRRFFTLCATYPLDLQKVHFFFMDEYLDENDDPIQPDHPLSFRGFIQQEFMNRFQGKWGFQAEQVYFPNPQNPQDYDRILEELGGVDVCFAGVGINGHLAFNEPPCKKNSPSRIVNLTRETITTNSHTALGGAWDLIPIRAVTVGMKSILESKKIRIYLNRPWQRAVVRNLLFGEVSENFPASFVQAHPDTKVVMTEEVASPPKFGLR